MKKRKRSYSNINTMIEFLKKGYIRRVVYHNENWSRRASHYQLTRIKNPKVSTCIATVNRKMALKLSKLSGCKISKREEVLTNDNRDLTPIGDGNCLIAYKR